MSPQLHLVAVQLQQTDGATDASEIDVVCSNQGPICEVLYEWTDNELFAEVTSFIIGVPVKITVIAGLALVLNRILRKGIGRLTDRLGTATAEHGDSVVTERSEWHYSPDGTLEGSEARVSAIRIANGARLCTMEAGCYFEETYSGSNRPRWTERHAAKSMAQTRAASKAYGMILRWIPVMAGYSGTPAEEMPAERSGAVDISGTTTMGPPKF